MEAHYNAFISYRHHPVDIRVAETIHKALEHYHIPKALREKSGKRLRLFRDKEELPITSNLSDDIHTALRNSDFLIVICSTHTAESVWVQREIKLFLESHDRSRVLTVLVDGEPYDTIPDILLHDDEGRDIEPLSCDWRQSPRVARREELPRLAAALLQCRYDDLRQREQRYRARKHLSILSAILAVCLVFMGYFLYSSLRIQENLEAALRNQSVYLSSESRRAMEEGDRMTAIALALEALPKEDGDRPYEPEAMYALSEAVGAYWDGSVAEAAGIVSTDDKIADFEATEDTDTLYVLEYSGKLTVWDARTFQQKGFLQSEEFDTKLWMTASENVIIRRGTGIVCCNDRAEVIWENPDIYEIAFTEDRTVVLGLDLEGTTLYRVDADTGLPVADPMPVPKLLDSGETHGFLQEDYDSRYPVAIKVVVGFLGARPEGTHFNAMALDLQTGEARVFARDLVMIRRTATDEQGNLYLMASLDGSGLMDGYFWSMITTSTCRTTVIRYDGKTLEEDWRQTLISYYGGNLEKLVHIPGSGRLFCAMGAMMTVLDEETGEILSQAEAPSKPVSIEVYPEKARLVLENGYSFFYYYDEIEQSGIPFMKSGLRTVKGQFALENDRHRIFVYRLIEDPEGTEIPGLQDPSFIRWSSADGMTAVDMWDTWFVLNEDLENLLQIPMQPEQSMKDILQMTLPSGEKMKSLRPSDENLESLLQLPLLPGESLLGIHDGIVWRKDDDNLISVNPLTEEVKRISLTDELGLSGYFGRNAVRLAGDRILLLEKAYSDPQQLTEYSLTTGEMRQWELGDPAEDSAEILTASPEYVLILADDRILEVSTTDGQVRVLAENVEGPVFADDLGELVALDCGGEVQLRTWGGDALFTRPREDRSVISFHLAGERLLGLGSDEKLDVYDLKGSRLLMADLDLKGMPTEIAQDAASHLLDDRGSCVSWEETEDGRLILWADGYINVLDMESWALELSPTATGMPFGDGFLLRSGLNAEVVLKYFPRYTVEDMIRKGEEALHGFQLSEEQRAAYGLLE